MFDNFERAVFKNLRGEGKLSAANMESALREIRMALLEADVISRLSTAHREHQAKGMARKCSRPSRPPSSGQDRSRGAGQDPGQPRIAAAFATSLPVYF